MKVTLKYSIASLILSLMVTSCKDILETDLKNQKITVISPVDGLKTSIYSQTFWWNEIDAATQYNIQIAIPSFDSLASIVVDTLVKTTKFVYTLKPGKYQWRINAQNGSSKTVYLTYNLTVIPGSLNQQTLVITAPVANTYQQSSSVDYKWTALSGALMYRIQIDTVTGNFITPLLEDSTSNTIYTYNFSAEGTYKWRVLAKDNSQSTPWSSPLIIGYDKTKPLSPVLTNPTNNATVSSPVSFTWDAVSDASKYNIYMYKGDTNTVYGAPFPVSLSSPSYSYTFTAGQTLYWRVTSLDKAGNESILPYAKKIVTQ